MVESAPGSNRNTPDVPGVIETIGLAFELLNRRPYLVWVLIAVDLIHWTGLRIAAREPLGGLWQRVGNEGKTQSPFADTLAEVDLVSVLTWPLPTLIDSEGLESTSMPVRAGLIQLDPGLAGVLLTISIVGSVMLLMGFLTQLARLTMNQPVEGIRLCRESARSTFKAFAAVFSLGAIIGFMMLPFAAIAAGLWTVSVSPTVLLTLSTMLLAGWLGLFFLFSLPALALGEHRTFESMRKSYQLVQGHFLAVVGLLIIIGVIRAGTPHALSIFMDSQWSIPFAIVANAYLATGLIASVMLFYQQRAIGHSTTSERSTATANG
jgi:hypothetical protein